MSFGNTFLARWSRLYANNTAAELAVEPAIAALGVPYRAQHPVFQCGAVLDFAFPRAKLAVEVDGPSHNTAKGKAKDAERTAKLARWGWRVVRMTNKEALTDPAGAVARIVSPALGVVP